ncbi:helix-turn-helix domain-containing protein [Actinosynnema sp. CS-041913]|uniref:helix-turn-helix domain-containing protein n=1 Tax=Actinosynnema sp. CS-041913 TaxID=3239917 RepID=UPI003D942FE4
MARAAHQAAFAARLHELKERSGRSYQALGRRCGLSSSTLHRYCTGGGVPAEFAPVERLGRLCAASRSELAELHRLWLFARVQREVERTGEPQPPTPAADRPTPVPRRPSRRRVGAWRAGVGVALVVALMFGLVTAGRRVPEQVAAGTAGPVPMWTNKPIRVSREFVGVTKNAASPHMPQFGVGSLRLWDSGTRWHKLEPERGRFEWFRLDRLVDPAVRAGVPVLLTLGGTPAWASPGGRETRYGDGSRTSPPDDLADWERFVRELATAYRGRIAGYELWDTANQQQGYSGTAETLVAMTERAGRVVKEVDPAATVVCPGMAELWAPGARQWMERFAELGGYRHCDVLGVKLHPRQASDPPESMLELATEIERSLYRAGAQALPMWNMGQGFSTPLEQPLDPEPAADHAVRYYLVSLYAEYRRVFFYNWGSDRIPIVLQPDGGKPTRAARHVEELGSWLTDSQNTSCGQGSKVGLPDNVWRCGFTKGDERFDILWTDRGSARLALPADVAAVEAIDGVSRTDRPSGSLDVTGRPVVLRLE